MTWMQYGSSTYELGSTKMSPRTTPVDIALSLAKLNRYTGHTTEPYSVAHHSMLVSALLDHNPVLALYGLVHDVAETVVQDLSFPMKQALGPDGIARYKEIEHAAEVALYGCLRILYPIPADIKALVKEQDWIASATEKRDLMPACDREWTALPYPPHDAILKPVKDWRFIAKQWYERYNSLWSVVSRLPPSPPPLFLPPPSPFHPPPPASA